MERYEALGLLFHHCISGSQCGNQAMMQRIKYCYRSFCFGFSQDAHIGDLQNVPQICHSHGNKIHDKAWYSLNAR